MVIMFISMYFIVSMICMENLMHIVVNMYTIFWVPTYILCFWNYVKPYTSEIALVNDGGHPSYTASLSAHEAQQ